MIDKNLNSCDTVSGLIIEYIDGELDPDTAALAERHICECTDCRKLYNDMIAVCRAASECAYDAPSGLHCRVMGAVKNSKTISRRNRLRRISAFAGIGVAAVICVSIGITAFFTDLGRFAGAGDKLGETNALAFGNPEADRHLLYPYSFVRSDDKRYQSLVKETFDASPEQTTEEKYSDGKTAETESSSTGALPDGTFADPTDKLVPPEYSLDMQGKSIPDDKLPDGFFGTWELPASNGAVITLFLLDDMTFSVTDTYGNVTAGSFTVNGDVITFTYPGGSSEYRFVVAEGELGFSPLAGAALIR